MAEMQSKWSDKYVEGGTWHKAWQKTLDGTYSVDAIRAFHKADFTLYYAEMPRDQFGRMEELARAILKSLAIQEAEKKDAERRSYRYGGSFLLDAMLPPAMAEDLHSSLAEFYPIWRDRHGGAKANFIVNIQILDVVLRRISTPLSKLFEIVVNALRMPN